jgi:starch synthase
MKDVGVRQPVERPALSSVEGLSILMVTSEAHPFAKTGGLAEVAAALTDAVARLGHSVTLVLPRYQRIDVGNAERLDATLAFGARLQPVTFYERRLAERVTVVFVDVPELFDREELYGTASGDYPDNARRFAVFSRAALEYPRLKQWRPSIIHAHDWQAGLVPVYQKMQFSLDPFVGGVPAVFTIHNLAFQGVFPVAVLDTLGLTADVMHVQAMEYWGNISFLKGGINFSEKITTVSPGYASEIVQPELGFGFDGVLARRTTDLVGILNGIDTARWNPTADPFVTASFTADDLTGKRDAKRALLSEVGLPDDDVALAEPLIGVISRLTDQKGFDLVAEAAPQLMALDARWVMLGNGEGRYETLWKTLATRHPDRVSATIGFNEHLAHHIEAGADMFLMPSRFEPCGLNQLYSLRYGTVPIVRATGGLNDTVEDVNGIPDRGNGFKFREYTAAALLRTVTRALALYQDAEAWKRVQQRGMREDHSWDVSAAAYVKLYEGMQRVR